MDDYHKRLINEALQGAHLSNVEEAADLYLNSSKDKNTVDEFSKCQDKLRKEIVNILKKHENFSMIGSEKILKLLQNLSNNEEDNNALASFNKFYSYFNSYNEVRKNLYSEEEKSSTVAYRLINENLPKFLDNIKAYSIAKSVGVHAEELTEEEQDCLFMVETFERTLTQDGIDNYNELIGKLNFAINQYNQQNNKNKGFRKVPMMKELYKQILSDREETFIDEFKDDDALLVKLESFSEDVKKFLCSDFLSRFAEVLKESGGEMVYVKNDASKTAFSNIVFGAWNVIDEMLIEEYDSINLVLCQDLVQIKMRGSAS